ncbi:MAG: efflux RND transporter periplasmic adaptor subunit [Deltaproteobacteria bacterium]|nr:efflux RND transporter periplasmic adaptor subunit [Deltaproteobacteria bacterium]
MKKRILLSTGILILLIIAAFSVWKYAGQSKAPETSTAKSLPSVLVAAATSGSISRAIEPDGTVEAARIARMSSPAEGPIINCGASVREGDHVKKGQQIVCIGRDKTVTAQYAAAKADLTREKGELDRVKKLVENGAISGDQLEIALARHENVKAQLARLEENRTDYMIRAPWSGVVSKVMVIEGDYVAPRTPLVEIFDPVSLVVRFAIPESESQNVHIGNGNTISVTLDAYPGKTFPARILRIYPKLDPSTRTRLVEAKIGEDISLTPGLFARIKMRVETHEDAVLVPAEAVLVNATGERMAFVVQDGKAVTRKVTTGIEAGRLIEIVSGVKPGEQIVVAGNEKLKDGAAVKLLAKKGGPDVKADTAKPAPEATKGTPR